MTELTHYAAQGFELDIEPHPVDGFRVFAPSLARALAVDSARNLCRGVPDSEQGWADIQTAGGLQETRYLTEAGFYRVLGSRQTGRIQDDAVRASVEAFQNWVYRDVLPSIRTTGGYQAPAPVPAKALTNRELAQMVLQEADRADAAERSLEAARPAVEYVERFVSNDDVVTVAVWGAQFGLSQPQAFALLLQWGAIYQWTIGERFSASAGRVVKVHEYRAKRGRVTWDWFDLRPQNNAPRHHNGQVRQTLYVRQAHAIALAKHLGLVPAAELERTGS